MFVHLCLNYCFLLVLLQSSTPFFNLPWLPCLILLHIVMGDVTTLNAIAEEIKTHSDSCVPLSKQIVQMAEDFDLDSIQKLADALDAC
jgi:hypothetical protein